MSTLKKSPLMVNPFLIDKEESASAAELEVEIYYDMEGMKCGLM